MKNSSLIKLFGVASVLAIALFIQTCECAPAAGSDGAEKHHEANNQGELLASKENSQPTHNRYYYEFDNDDNNKESYEEEIFDEANDDSEEALRNHDRLARLVDYYNRDTRRAFNVWAGKRSGNGNGNSGENIDRSELISYLRGIYANKYPAKKAFSVWAGKRSGGALVDEDVDDRFYRNSRRPWGGSE